MDFILYLHYNVKVIACTVKPGLKPTHNQRPPGMEDHVLGVQMTKVLNDFTCI